MAKSTYTVSKALKLLRKALVQSGLERVNITVSCHGLTTEEGHSFAQKLLASGFGEALTEPGQSHEYSHRAGQFSWVTVVRGSDEINLFYNLEEVS